MDERRSLLKLRGYLASITGRILQLSNRKASTALGAATNALASTTAATSIMGVVGALGTVSTGTAIAGLAGAAKTSATLFWIGGIAGGGVAAGAVIVGAGAIARSAVVGRKPTGADLKSMLELAGISAGAAFAVDTLLDLV